jgi:hypothetical protein
MATRADFGRIARHRIRITPDAQLDPSAVDKTGSTVNILVNAAAAIGEELEARSIARFAAQSVASARGADLDRLILERSKGKLPRKTASAAVIDLQVYRTSAAAGEGVIDAGTEVLAGGLTWTLNEPVVFTASALQGGLVPATCTSLGTAGNGVSSGVQKFKNPGALFDASLIVEAQASAEPAAGIASAGGDDRETDEAYRARYALWDAGLDRNLEFLAAGVLGVGGVATASSLEDLDLEGTPTGAVTVFFGDPNGRVNSALQARVRVALRGFRLAGQEVRLVGTTPSYQALVLRFGVLDTGSIAQAQEEARNASVSYVNSLPPGATLDPAAIRGVLAGIPNLVFLESAPLGVLTPAAPVVPSSKSTIYKTRPDLVSFG